MSGLIEPQLIAEFSVAGIPRPQGSMRAFAHRTTGKIVVTGDNAKTALWKRDVAEAARAGRVLVWEGPVKVGIVFRLPRPKGHVGKTGLLPSAPRAHATKPDLDKLVRAVLDSLTNSGVITDDAQVVRLAATKATQLWTLGLPKLAPTDIVDGRTPRVHHASPGPDRWKERSRTLPGIAAAMAAQWGSLPIESAA